MFKNKEEFIKGIEGCYKKLKSYYYYDKTLLHIKKRIVEYEANIDFKERLCILAQKLMENDKDYFYAMIEKIDAVVLPKTMKSVLKDEKLIKGTVDRNKKISKVNFSIDMDVELLIVDMLWGLCIKKIYMTKYGEFNYSYAGKFKKGVFKFSDDLVNGIDYKSNRCFEPYFGCYSQWRNMALDTVVKRCKDENIVMLSLDIKSFYYSVNFDFNELKNLFADDKRYKEIEFLTNIINCIYKKYTEIIRKYKKGMPNDIDKLILPIGMISPIIVREILLKNIDDCFVNKLHPRYYGRYVDDILLVLKVDEETTINSETIVDKLLLENGIVNSKKKNGEYEFVLRPTLKLQSEKINCFYFDKGRDNVLIDVYYKQIKKNSSEANLLPDVDLLSESFNSSAYAMNSSDDTGKIRNLEFLESDNYKATIFINGLKRVLKNTSYDKKNIEKYLVDIMKFYSGSQAIEYSNSWRTIFELMILCKDKERANIFYRNIKEEVNSITFDYLEESEIYAKKKKEVLKKLKKSMIMKLDISIALALALDYERGKFKIHKELAVKIRHANMLNHNMVSFPLINYSTDDSIASYALINMNLNEILSDLTLRKKLFALDEEKIYWTPRFIHLNELYYCVFYFYVGNGKSLIRSDNEKVFQSYLKMNSLSDKIPNPIIYDEDRKYKNWNISRKDVRVLNYLHKGDSKIGLVNTKIREKDVLNTLLHPEKGITVEKKQSLYKLLNVAKEQKIKYLIFPEFYMPALWLNDIGEFAKKSGITIISGLQYITCNKNAYNIICVLASTCGNSFFKNIIPFFREKNYYAPDERLELAALGYNCFNPQEAEYYLLSDQNVSFSTILCFEFTDIASRAIMKGDLDFLCVPQLNRDTNYFSSIVESAARDLHTLVVQANTSIYGDSRITGPYKTDYKDVLKIKGGENELLIVGKLKTKELQEFREKYYVEYEKQVQKCMNCKKIHSIEQMDMYCRKCKNKKNKGKIKGLPPNWR